MSKVKVMDGQSLWDIAIQETGTIETVFEFARLNFLSITADIEAGSILGIPMSSTSEVKVVRYLADRNIKPATSISNSIYRDGIEYWAIENDFIVN